MVGQLGIKRSLQRLLDGDGLMPYLSPETNMAGGRYTSLLPTSNFMNTIDEEDELPCYREQEEDGTWSCVNDHTGCLYNDGHNGCTFEGKSVCPLEEEVE